MWISMALWTWRGQCHIDEPSEYPRQQGYAQRRNFLMRGGENSGRRSNIGEGSRSESGRGLAYAISTRRDLDMLMNHQNGPAYYTRNDQEGISEHSFR